MKRVFWALVIVFVLGAGSSAWCNCPEQPLDLGECDSLWVEPYGAQPCASLPATVRLLFLVSHDLYSSVDSLTGFTLPITITGRTNPTKYCSISTYWNTTSTMYVDVVNFPRSVFRHVIEGSDTLYHNRMAVMDSDFSFRAWDFKELSLGDQVSRFFLATTPLSSQDQRWWEGTRVLLASANLLVEDTMTICIDTTFWSPNARLTFYNYNTDIIIPRHNLPFCFKVDTAKGNDVREIHDAEDSRPSEFSLSQNYPNPFNPVTNIRFTVLRTANVKLDVYNIVGQKVRTLVDEEMTPGTYAVDWDGTDESGKAVSSGIYFYRMQAADEFTDMKKMLLVK
jgi:hypothetical protein